MKVGSGLLRAPQLTAGTMAAVARLHGARHCAGAVCAPASMVVCMAAVLAEQPNLSAGPVRARIL